eukprot:210521-Prymnesium_polylepis.1
MRTRASTSLRPSGAAPCGSVSTRKTLGAARRAGRSTRVSMVCSTAAAADATRASVEPHAPTALATSSSSSWSSSLAAGEPLEEGRFAARSAACAASVGASAVSRAVPTR